MNNCIGSTPSKPIGRRSLLKSTAVVAGALLGGLGRRSAFAGARRDAEEALANVELNCGFKPRRSRDPSQLAYGCRVRDQMQKDALDAIERARSQGWLAQLRAAEDVLERATAQADPAHLGELWLSVEGTVGGRYRDRHYVAAVAA
jgi:hypothetical protein